MSVVLCFPHSGRMHQIRVHLQYLGTYSILFIIAVYCIIDVLPTDDVLKIKIPNDFRLRGILYL